MLFHIINFRPQIIQSFLTAFLDIAPQVTRHGSHLIRNLIGNQPIDFRQPLFQPSDTLRLQ